MSSLSIALWRELLAQNIRILCVEPGTIQTEFAAVAEQAPHGGHHAQDVTEHAMNVLENTAYPTAICGWYIWLRAQVASLLPYSLVTRLAQRKMSAIIQRVK